MNVTENIVSQNVLFYDKRSLKYNENPTNRLCKMFSVEKLISRKEIEYVPAYETFLVLFQ